MSFIPATRDDLRVGLYIKLVGNWFAHPFPTNCFKIKNEKELAILRALRNYKIVYDPQRSDPLPPSVTEDDTIHNEASSTPRADNLRRKISPYHYNAQNFQANHVRLEKLKEAERAYQEVLKQNKDGIREIKAGYAKGARKAENLVNTLAQILNENGTLVSLMNFLGNQEIGDEFYYHSLNVCMLSLLVGKGLGLPEDVQKMLGIGALFHDIGELDGIGMFLPKGTKINKLEQQHLRNHPQNGRILMEKYGFPKPSLEAISQHHERLNGNGYPDGLKGDSIHVLSRIVMVADA